MKVRFWNLRREQWILDLPQERIPPECKRRRLSDQAVNVLCWKSVEYLFNKDTVLYKVIVLERENITKLTHETILFYG